MEAHRRHDWLLHAVEQRLREALAVLHVTINEEKSRRVKSQRGVWRPWYTPMRKKRTALLRKLKEILRRYESQPVDRVVDLINPMLRGWVRYFAVGDSHRCFGFIKDWVEKKVRRHLRRARKRKGFGWKRWSRRWLYDPVGLFHNYRVSRPQPKVLPAREVP